jgi:hypothetical protein
VCCSRLCAVASLLCTAVLSFAVLMSSSALGWTLYASAAAVARQLLLSRCRHGANCRGVCPSACAAQQMLLSASTATLPHPVVLSTAAGILIALVLLVMVCHQLLD